MDFAYWQRLGDSLGWRSQFRDDAYNDAPTDSRPRTRGYVDYLVIHHTATASEAVAVGLMMPGGRLVTCNRVTGTDGKFRRNIREHRRAYTSASWLDDIADTTEVVNTSGGPTYGMSDLSIIALAIWAVEKFRGGRLKEISRRYIIGHYEVLGISGAGYVTSCPGPNTIEADRRLDLVTELAQHIYAGRIGPALSTTTERKAIDMSQITYVERVTATGAFDQEWMIVGRDLGVAEGGAFAQDGYRIATPAEWPTARQWSRLYGWGEPDAKTGERRPIKLQRDDYIALQNYAREQAQEYRRVHGIVDPSEPANA